MHLENFAGFFFPQAFLKNVFHAVKRQGFLHTMEYSPTLRTFWHLPPQRWTVRIGWVVQDGPRRTCVCYSWDEEKAPRVVMFKETRYGIVAGALGGVVSVWWMRSLGMRWSSSGDGGDDGCTWMIMSSAQQGTWKPHQWQFYMICTYHNEKDSPFTALSQSESDKPGWAGVNSCLTQANKTIFVEALERVGAERIKRYMYMLVSKQVSVCASVFHIARFPSAFLYTQISAYEGVTSS